MKSTFFIALHTNVLCGGPEEYMRESAKMASVMHAVFGDEAKVQMITKNAPLTACHCEAEVSHGEMGMVGKALLDMEAPAKVVLDKPKLSAIVKGLVVDWPDLKIEKRTVTQET